MEGRPRAFMVAKVVKVVLVVRVVRVVRVVWEDLATAIKAVPKEAHQVRADFNPLWYMML